MPQCRNGGTGHAEAVSYVDAFVQAVGLGPAKAPPPPIGYSKPRVLRLEQLAARQMLANDVLASGIPVAEDDVVAVADAAFPDAGSSWQNPGDPLDANGDGRVTAQDALLIVNALTAAGPGSLAAVPSEVLHAWGPAYVDVNGDGQLSTADFDMIAVPIWMPTRRWCRTREAPRRMAARRGGLGLPGTIGTAGRP
jgi:hypothetical protein